MTPIVILSRRHAGALFRRLRLQSGLTQTQVARRLRSNRYQTVMDREKGHAAIPTEALIDTAGVFGMNVALVPRRHPGARPTGTGWPT